MAVHETKTQHRCQSDKNDWLAFFAGFLRTEKQSLLRPNFFIPVSSTGVVWLHVLRDQRLSRPWAVLLTNLGHRSETTQKN